MGKINCVVAFDDVKSMVDKQDRTDVNYGSVEKKR